MSELLSDELILILSKGVRLPVYLLLCNHPEGLSQNNLIILTGFSHNTLAQSLSFLALKRMIIRTVSSDGFQRWFAASGLEVTDYERVMSKIDTPTTTINKDSNINPEERSRRGVSKIDTPDDLDTGGKSIELWNEIWSELGMASVFKNDRSLKMARMRHITPEYIRKCRKEWRGRKKGGAQWAGAFLTMLETTPVIEEVEAPKSVEENVADFLRPRR
jgi:hypothetical protein